MNHIRTVIAFFLCLLYLTSATSFAQVGVSRSGCISSTLPGPDEAIIYRDANYRGDCRILAVGNYDPTAFGLPNDKVSSFKVGEDVQIDLYLDVLFYMFDLSWKLVYQGPDLDDPDYDPRAGIHWRGVPDLREFLAPGNRPTWNDRTSSIRVQRKDHLRLFPGPGQAVLFTEANFNKSCNPRSPCDYILKDKGAYATTLEVGLMNDSISSIRVGPDTIVVVCSDAWFSGVCDEFRSDQPSLGETRIGNDHVTSIRVCALGYRGCGLEFHQFE
jgi:hypothetical protein